MQTIALDVYGTIIDLSGILVPLSKMVGKKATALSILWRSKQLEYIFRRGLMENYVRFGQITHEALQYALTSLNISLSAAMQQELLAAYSTLPSFPDAAPGLHMLKEAGCSVFAFSNGDRYDILQVLTNANLINFFDGIISVENVKTFKPSPKVYQYFEKKTKYQSNEITLISSNPFDLIGATHVGWTTIWIKRQKKLVFDPWQIKPAHTTIDLLNASNHVIK